MFHVVLIHPQIPPNTGNVIRLCANVGARLHLVEPLGFDIDDASLRRAGLDYREYVDMTVHPDLEACRLSIGTGSVGTGENGAGANWYAFSRDGRARYDQVRYEEGDVLVFGSESDGLSAAHRAEFGETMTRLPMQPGNRSLNLSNAVAVVAFEAWRQHGFAGSDQ